MHTDQQSKPKILDDFKIAALPQNAGVARDRVKNAANVIGIDPIILDEIIVAVGEAVTNAILYGSSDAEAQVRVRCFTEDNDSVFVIEITDRGQGFDPDHVRQAESEDALGGRGLRLMRALTDRLIMYYDNDGMNVRLSKNLR